MLIFFYSIGRRGSRKFFRGGGGPTLTYNCGSAQIWKITNFSFPDISAILSFANSRGGPDSPDPLSRSAHELGMSWVDYNVWFFSLTWCIMVQHYNNIMFTCISSSTRCVMGRHASPCWQSSLGGAEEIEAGQGGCWGNDEGPFWRSKGLDLESAGNMQWPGNAGICDVTADSYLPPLEHNTFYSVDF